MDGEPVDARAAAGRLLRLFAFVQARSGNPCAGPVGEIGLTPAQHRALTTLARRADPITVRQLAGAIGLSAPATSRLVDDLAGRGLISRREDRTDRRQKRLAMTPAGIQVLERLEEARLGDLSSLLSTLGQDELRALLGAIAPVLRLADGSPA